MYFMTMNVMNRHYNNLFRIRVLWPKIHTESFS